MRDLLASALVALVLAAPLEAARDPSPEEKQVFAALNQLRRGAGSPPLTWDPVSAETLRQLGATRPVTEKVISDDLQRAIEARRGYGASWAYSIRYRSEPLEDYKAVLDDPELLSREYTHASAAVVEAPSTGGRPLTFVGVYLCRIPPLVTRRTANSPAGDYRFRCWACGRQKVFSLSSPHETLLECPFCKTTISPWLEDMRKVLHWPTWYVQPWAPFDTDNPFLAWQLVNEQVQYDHRKADHDLPGWQTAEETSRMGKGVCRDTAVYLAAWLRHSGKDARVVTGLLDGDHHAWVILSDGETRYLLETAMDANMNRRYPPRLELATRYLPTRMMFDDRHLWLNRGQVKARDYDSPQIWIAAEEAP